MSEQMRSEFEAFKEGHSRYLDVFSLETYSDGDYVDSDVQLAWEAWQASRAALCVELPADKDMSHNHEREAARLSHNDAVEACREAIHAAGVKTK